MQIFCHGLRGSSCRKRKQLAEATGRAAPPLLPVDAKPASRYPALYEDELGLFIAGLQLVAFLTNNYNCLSIRRPGLRCACEGVQCRLLCGLRGGHGAVRRVCFPRVALHRCDA